jgi:hypothetical protein
MPVQQPGVVPAAAVQPVAAAPVPVVDATPLEEEGTISMETILMVAGGAVVLVLLLTILLGKKKK